MFLGREIRRFGFLADGEMEQQGPRDARRACRCAPSPRCASSVASLSGGQRQTVAIAKAVLWNSKVVFLDEPTAALGVAQTRQVLDLVRRLADQGRGVVLISHNMNDVMEVADRVAALYLGRIAAEVHDQGQQHHPDRRADHRRPQRRHRPRRRPPPTRASEGPMTMTTKPPETNVDAGTLPHRRPAPASFSLDVERAHASATRSRDWIGRLRSGDPGALPSVLGLIVLGADLHAGQRPVPDAATTSATCPARAPTSPSSRSAWSSCCCSARSTCRPAPTGGICAGFAAQASSPAACTRRLPGFLYWA